MNKYLINLIGVAEIEMFFADKDIYDWILIGGPVPAKLIIDWQRECPKDTVNEIIKKVAPHPRSSSPDSDRALSASVAAVNKYYSVKDVIEQVKIQDINIIEEYNGRIY